MRETLEPQNGGTQENCEELLAHNEYLRAELEFERSRVQQLTAMWQRATRWKRLLAFGVWAPADWFFGCTFIGAELVFRLLRRIAPQRPPAFPIAKPECSFIVVSWNGKDLLAQSLPALLQAIRRHGGNHQVIVVDNGSVDDTDQFVQSNFPEVLLIRSETNRFFSGGNRLGMEAADRDIVVLLNNDMIVDPDFMAPLLEPFANPEVFGVASRVFLPPGKPPQESGKTRIRFNGCDFDWSHDPITISDEQKGVVPVIWLHGGAAAMDRRKYLWLGGLDQLYDPFYVEDADLSYRAWKIGWRCLLAVQSHVLHRHRSSTLRFGEEFVREIVARNHAIFFWKDIEDFRLLALHFARCARMKARRAGVVGVGIRRQMNAWVAAVMRVPAILARKFHLARLVVRSDQEIFDLISRSDQVSDFSAQTAGQPRSAEAILKR